MLQKKIIFSIKKANPSLWSLTLKLDCTKTGNIQYIQHILRSTCFTPLLEDRGRGQGLLCYSIEVWFKHWFTHGCSMLLPLPARGSVQTTTWRSGFQKLVVCLPSCEIWMLLWKSRVPSHRKRDVRIWGHSSGLFLALIENVAEVNLERYNWFSQTEHSPGSWATEAVGYGRANNLLQVFPLLFEWLYCM